MITFISTPTTTIIPIFNITSSIVNSILILRLILKLRISNIKLPYTMVSLLFSSLVTLPISVGTFLSIIIPISLKNIFFFSWSIIPIITSTYIFSNQETKSNRVDLTILYISTLLSISCLTHSTEIILLLSALLSGIMSLYVAIKHASKNFRKIITLVLTILQILAFSIDYLLNIYTFALLIIAITNVIIMYLTIYYIMSWLSEEKIVNQELVNYLKRTKELLKTLVDIRERNEEITKKQNKVVIFFQQDNQKLYSHLRYFSNFLNNVSGSIPEVKFLIKDIITNLTKIISKIEELINSETEFKNNLTNLEENISKAITYYEEQKKYYETLSSNLIQLTLITNEINNYIKSQGKTIEKIVENLDSLSEITNLIFNISIEGEITSQKNKVTPLQDSFKKIKLKIEETESKIIYLKTALLDRNSKLLSLFTKNEDFREEIYKTLSTTDKIVSNLSSILNLLSTNLNIIKEINNTLDKSNNKNKVKEELIKLNEELLVFSENAFSALDSLDEVLKLVTIVKENLTTITNSSEEIIKASNISNKELESLTRTIEKMYYEISSEV